MADFEQENNIFIYDRKKLEATGITDVIAFSDTCVEMALEEGSLAIDGSDLKIESFSSGTRKISITGFVSAVSYYGKPAARSGFFRRKRD